MAHPKETFDPLPAEIDKDRLARLLDSLEYIESNLQTDIDLDEAARRACLSRFRFQRVFAKATGLTPGEYFRSRRLSEAAEDLLNSSKSIESLSMHWGYDNFSAFSRAFKHQFGKSPSQFRQEALIHNHIDHISPMDEDLLKHWNLGGVMNIPEITTQTSMTLVGPTFSNGYEQTLEKWVSEVRQVHLNHRQSLLFQEPVLWLVQHGNAQTVQARTNLSLLGIEKHLLREIPSHWVEVNIPSGIYSRFEHRGHSQELFNYTARFIWERWWKTHDKNPFDWVLCRIDSGLLDHSAFIGSGALYLPETSLRSALLPWEIWDFSC